MFERNKIICIDLDSPDYISNISITKNDVRFSIKIKETLEKDFVGKALATEDCTTCGRYADCYNRRSG